jgi:hypothetical protein
MKGSWDGAGLELSSVTTSERTHPDWAEALVELAEWYIAVGFYGKARPAIEKVMVVGLS